ncbi:MAG TPA: hypothetical protein PLI05_11830, partial [Methanotrichaceae archaeon]|nr:hypothetical protein [Methanotrichaceae archaeon]HQF17739.1 hypothetical protein [Methanotrichaceae archaeon]HQI92362.1 hypothetical protein [Methanotrichaceae archaeon]
YDIIEYDIIEYDIIEYDIIEYDIVEYSIIESLRHRGHRRPYTIARRPFTFTGKSLGIVLSHASI